jgi:hypothetical protein
LAADIVRELQKLDEDALKRRTGDLHELLLFVPISSRLLVRD